jgi:uncharacterized membrane protein YoaT (DUF817 family)
MVIYVCYLPFYRNCGSCQLKFFRLKAFHRTICNALSPDDSEIRLVFWLKQLFLFGYLQAISCVFPIIIFAALAISSIPEAFLPRYDLLLLICIIAQLIMYKAGLETLDEVYVITLFHILGLVMELHKVNAGSWSYPEPAYSKVFGVPLYSGFMYASVGSYLCQAWRNLSIETIDWPGAWTARLCGVAIYLNFFTNAFIMDVRWWIVLVLVIVFRKSKFAFMLGERKYHIHVILAFFLIGFFIWLGENIATFYGAWKYAYQHAGWKMVTWHKISSWSLLVIVSIIIIAELKRIKHLKQTRTGSLAG